MKAPGFLLLMACMGVLCWAVLLHHKKQSGSGAKLA